MRARFESRISGFGSRVYVQRFQGGLVFKAHRLVYHSTLSWTVMKKKKKDLTSDDSVDCLKVRRVCGEVQVSSLGFRVEGLGLTSDDRIH